MMSLTSTRHLGYKLLNIALWFVSVLAGVLLVGLVVMTFMGMRLIVVKTGSMSPTIRTNSVIIAREINADKVKEGDVISFRTDQRFVTHRAIEVKHENNVTKLTTKGDANKTADATEVITKTVWKEYTVISGLGRVVPILSSRIAFLLAGALGAITAAKWRRINRSVAIS